MPSLNLDVNYFDHIKTVRLVSRLGPGADVLPIRLWAYVGRCQPGSSHLKMNGNEIENVCRWWGKQGDMIAAMVEIKFLIAVDDLYEVNDWFEHSGHLAAFKKRAVKAAKKRWMLKRASSIAKPHPKQCSCSTCCAVHNQPAKHVITSPPIHKGFVKPTAQEATEYARSINFKLDGEAFVAHYEARGWKYGAGRPMVDWKSAVVTWKKKAEPSAIIQAPKPLKPAEVLPKEEDLVSQEDLRGLRDRLRTKVIPHA